MIGSHFAPTIPHIAPTQNIPNPRLKKAQLLLGLLAKRCNQLIFKSSLGSFYCYLT